ncbi:MAG: hypothetical protein PHY55_06335 [Bacteroidales bacterium]|nr:hypothetical protein [Bacteroidales bacterium]
MTTSECESEEFINLFGRFIEITEIDESYGRKNSYVQYISGINNFDEYLEGIKFSNTNLQHHFIAYEKGIGFLLSGKNDNLYFNILKTDIESIIAYHNQSIEICDVNQILNIMKTGMLAEGGIAGVLVTKAVGHLGDAILKKFKPVKSKIIKGSIYEIRTRPINNKAYTIKISCRDENSSDINKLFDKHLNFGLSKNDPKENCYIATVCYENPNSIEVITFKKFRDITLANSFLGRKVVKYYYKHSPSISRLLYTKKSINRIIRDIFLNPIYFIIKNNYR